MKRAIATFSLLAGLLAGCNLSGKPAPPPMTPTPTALPVALPTPAASFTIPAPTLTATPGDLENLTGIELPQTYVNSVIGYAFDYPAGWFVTDCGTGCGWAVYLFSYDPSTTPFIEGIPEGQSKFDFNVNSPDTYTTLDEWWAAFDAGPGRILEGQRFLVRSGLEVVRVRYRVCGSCGEEQMAYLALINDRGLLISVVTDRTYMDDIVNSLRLAQ